MYPFIIILLSLAFNTSVRNKLMFNDRISSENQNRMKISTTFNMEQPGILLRGWFKYFMITPSKTSQDFEINPEYAHYNDVLPGEEKAKEDDTGSLDIPDEKSFQFVMTGTTINILSSRRNMITKTIDVIDLNVTDKIKMETDKDGNEQQAGGLKSMGVFDEGRCFQLTLKVGFKYIICSSDYKKEKLMEQFVQRIQDAKIREDPNALNGEMTSERNFTIDMEKFDLPKFIKEQTKPFKEGEIEDLGDWSICDKVCGGGDQEKWRGCKPPMPVGVRHTCKKKPVKLSRKCNTQPCQNGQKSDVPVIDMSWKALQPTITLPAHLDARFVSHRYQEYEECKIKDEDLCIMRSDLKRTLDMEEAPILPGRGILNRKTFSFYENSKYDSLQRSQLLEDIQFNSQALNSNCFEVKSKNEASDKLVLCGCPFTPGAGEVADTWMKEINKFRYSCGDQIQDGAIPLTDKDKIQMKIGNEEVEIGPEQMKAMAQEAAQEKEKDAAQLAEEAEAAKMDAALNGLEEITAEATNNEFQKEELMQKENQKKQREDLKKLDMQIQKAEEKLKCMQAGVKREAARQAKARATSSHKEEIKEIKAEVEKEVAAVKKTFHKKVDTFTQETERLKAKKLQQLTKLRQQMTKMIMDQNTRGSRSNCLVDKDEQKINYCNAKFTSDWFANKNCRLPEAFCGVCCDAEFSVTFAEDREKCIYECSLKSGQLTSSNDKVSESNYTANVEKIVTK